MEDLKPGMMLTGTVRNVVDFGAFVDIGVKHDGLVHVSELSDKFVKDPNQVVAVGDIVEVRVVEVYPARKRIALSMKKEPPAGGESGGTGEKPVPAKYGAGRKPGRRNEPAPPKKQEDFGSTSLRESLLKAGFRVK